MDKMSLYYPFLHFAGRVGVAIMQLAFSLVNRDCPKLRVMGGAYYMARFEES